MSPWHHKASNAQPELVSLHGLTNIKPVYSHPHNPPLSYPLSDSNISPPTKYLTGKQLQNMSLQDLSTDMLDMSCKQLRKKVAIMLGDIGDARTRWIVDVFAGSVDTDYSKLD